MHVNGPWALKTYVSGNFTSETFSSGERNRFFKNTIPTPGYLIAIVAGDLEERKVGPWTYVISDAEYVDQCAWELDLLESAISEGEKYTGIPYAWGDYKIVILPGNFPYGGMENPTLTFASKLIIVGDKSGVATAVHEVSHSWTGNMVTNMNWDNFWLNEGFDKFLEWKISGVLFGDSYVKIEARNGNNSMYSAMLNFGLDNSFSSLNPWAGTKNPDDAFSSIPYEKGY